MTLAADSNPVHTARASLERTLGTGREIELTILMPCLNEAETLGACIEKAHSFLERTGITGEIVLADNGSTDGSQAIARARGARVVAVQTRGYGAALRDGINAARGRYVIMGDSDSSYDFSALDAFMDKLRSGCELVMGNRFKGGIAPSAMPALHRYLGNPVLSAIGRLFFRSPISDFHCGLRGFSRAAILDLKLESPGMEFASEMVVKATIAGLSIAEVPTTLFKDGRSRPPHLRSWRDGWRHLKLLLTLAPDWLFLYPGALLAGAGLLLASVLLPGPLILGDVKLDTATLLFAVAATLVGSQMMAFFIVAKAFAVAQGLLPSHRRFARLAAGLTVDRLCLCGGGLLVLGFAVGGLAVLRWVHAGFGDMELAVIARFAAIATLAMALGIQSATVGFLLALVQTQRVLPATAHYAVADDPRAIRDPGRRDAA